MGKSFQNKEIFQRINYLYQAAYLCLKSNPDDLSVCRFYVHILKTIARRQVLRLHYEMKRKFCKKCCVLLVPGVSCRIRIRNKREKHTVVTCMECGTIKRFMWRQNHELWISQPQAWLEREKNTET